MKLKNRPLSETIKVWKEGLENWVDADELPELKGHFPPETSFESTFTPSPISSETTNPPKTWLIESILVTLFCCLPLGIVGVVNATRVESRFYAGDIEGVQIC